MAIFLKNTTFHGILLDALFEAGTDNPEKAAVVRCMSEGIAAGAVRPLPATVFADQQLEQAFRSVIRERRNSKRWNVDNIDAIGSHVCTIVICHVSTELCRSKTQALPASGPNGVR